MLIPGNSGRRARITRIGLLSLMISLPAAYGADTANSWSDRIASAKTKIQASNVALGSLRTAQSCLKPEIDRLTGKRETLEFKLAGEKKKADATDKRLQEALANYKEKKSLAESTPSRNKQELADIQRDIDAYERTMREARDWQQKDSLAIAITDDAIRMIADGRKTIERLTDQMPPLISDLDSAITRGERMTDRGEGKPSQLGLISKLEVKLDSLIDQKNELFGNIDHALGDQWRATCKL